MTPPAEFWLWSAAVAAGLAGWLVLPAPPRAVPAAEARPGRSRAPSWTASARPDAPSLRVRSAAGGALGLAVALLLGRFVGAAAWPVGLAAAVLAVLLLGHLEPLATRQRRARSVAQTPEVLDLLSAGLTAGMPLRSAVRAVVAACPGPITDDLARLLRQVDLGAGDADAWRGLVDHPQLGPVAADLARSVESGTTLTTALTVHAQLARESHHAAVEEAARTVGVRCVFPLMTCFIPAFLLLGVVPTVVSALLRVVVLP